MRSDQSRVIVEDGLCACCSVHTKQLHHRDFPEIRVECGSVAEGVTHLTNQLARAREGIQSVWRREAIDQAIADVGAYFDSLEEGRPVRAPQCTCGPRAAGRPDPAVSESSPNR